MQFSTCYLHQLSEEDYQQCLNANMGSNGSMRDDLIHARNFQIEACVVLCKENDQLLGWAFLEDKGDCKESQYFVYEKYRRRGIGTRLVKEIQKIEKNALACPWDKASDLFFQKVKMELMPGFYFEYFLETV